MKCNVRELAHMSDMPCIIEGRLNYKKISNSGYLNQNAFKERWFRLVNNYLFYYKISEMGKFDTSHPAGVFVMENSSIDMEHGHSIPFAFSISFIDEPERRHLFAARTEHDVVQWVMKLRQCSYEYLRAQLHTLQSKIFSITGKDPLLLVPRNDGAKLWEPSSPRTNFVSHLHTNGALPLERSKSDVQARRRQQQTLFYTKDDTLAAGSGFPLDRSLTTVIAEPPLAIFDNRLLYSRAAPSPPARKKTSPRKPDPSLETKMLAETGRNLAQMGILDSAPVPPRRKVSPRTLGLPPAHADNVSSETNDVEDLIKF